MARRCRLKHVRILPKLVKDVAEVIDFILAYHSAGMMVLCGDVEFPDTLELYDALSSMTARDDIERVQGGEDVPKNQRILERVDHILRTLDKVGGAQSISRAMCDLKRQSPNEFALLKDASLIRRGRPYSIARYDAARIASRHHMSASAMRRNRNYIVLKLAHEIAYPGQLVPVYQNTEISRSN